MWWMLAAAATAAPEVLIVATPGVGLEGYRPLVAALRDRGVDPAVVELPCSGDAATLSAAIGRAVRGRPGAVVVAHGLGATLALLGAPDAEVSRWVLLAPWLGVPDTAAVRALAGRPVVGPPALDRPAPWSGHDLRRVLLGDRLPPLGCFPAALARDLLGWLEAGAVPVTPEAVAAPVWIGGGLLDELAPPEVLVPASRRFPERELVRLGIQRLDPVDYAHADLLSAPGPVRAAVNAAVGEDR